MTRPVENVRFFVGVMSKNTVDAVLEFCDENDCHDVFGLIPSRRQVDMAAGYANGWTTAGLVAHVAGRLVIQRDHAGPMQGHIDDSGLESLENDMKSGIVAIHVDPWKAVAACGEDEKLAATATATMMDNACRFVHDRVTFEIGTEQAVRNYDAAGLRVFLDALRHELHARHDVMLRESDSPVLESASRLYDKVTHIVVQTGTGIGNLKNTGVFDEAACGSMLEVCAAEGKLSKEHNSDYLSADELSRRLAAGIHSFNFAPEFGVAETQVFMRLMREHALHIDCDEFKRHCAASDKWHRWVSSDSDDQLKTYACGHYFFSSPLFKAAVDGLRRYVDFDSVVKSVMKERLTELLDTLRRAP